MEEIERPESERLQFSLKAFFVGTLIASVVVGLIVYEPNIFFPITAVFVIFGLPAWCFAKKKPFWGFFFLALFVFLLPFLSFGSTVLLPKLGVKRRINPDRNMVLALRMALDKYESDCGAYPPVGAFKHSSMALYDALVRRPPAPYIELNAGHKILRQDGEVIFVSKEGDPLMYMPIQRPDGKRGFVLVFPGRDRLIGGKLSPAEGFVPDNSDANGDGIPDHADNMIEQMPSK